MRGSLLVLLLAALPGCAFIPSQVDINYTPTAAVAPILGASSVTVAVAVADSRGVPPAQIGVKKNGYGIEMASINATRPVADIIRDAIVQELKKEGFTIGSGDVAVNVELNRVVNDFKLGFFSGDAVAEVLFSAQVKRPDGRLAFSKVVTGTNKLPDVMIAEGYNAKAAIEPAIASAVGKLVTDPSFTQALQQGNRDVPGS